MGMDSNDIRIVAWTICQVASLDNPLDYPLPVVISALNINKGQGTRADFDLVEADSLAHSNGRPPYNE